MPAGPGVASELRRSRCRARWHSNAANVAVGIAVRNVYHGLHSLAGPLKGIHSLPGASIETKRRNKLKLRSRACLVSHAPLGRAKLIGQRAGAGATHKGYPPSCQVAGWAVLAVR